MPRSSALYDASDTLALDWKGLYQEHAPRLRRIAERRVGTEQADDVVQDTFMRAFRNRGSLDPTRPIGAWLSSITLCSSTDTLRRRSARPEVPAHAELEPAAAGTTLEDEFDNAVRRVGIEAAFDSLNHRQRRVLKRLEVDGWTQEEVAAFEQISPEAVKSLAARARRTFREAYSAFADRMGVFGGAVVGTTVVKLRSRIQRWQGLAGEHVGAFGMAAATITVVAIATVPSTRPTPTMADESVPAASDGTTGVSAAASSTSGGADSGTASSAPMTAAASARPATTPAPDPGNEGGSTIPADVSTEASAGRHGAGAGVSFYEEESIGGTNGRTYAGVTVSNCDANLGTQVECAAIDAAAGTQ